MVKCLHCGYEGKFKLIRTWRYRWWDAYLYQCPNCGGRFRNYLNPTGKYKNFIIARWEFVKKGS